MKTIQMNRRDFFAASSAAVSLLVLNSPALSSAESRESAQLEPLLKEMESQGPKMLSVPRKDGQFLHLLVKTSRARNVLEVGTSQGYSTIWISRALGETGGKLTTIDIAPEKVALARTNVAKAGLADRIKFLEGDAHKIVPTLAEKFDLVFLDADKEGQMDYFKKVYPNMLPPGGILAVHNAIRLGGAMKDFLEMIQAHPDFDSVILSLTMEDGFSISYRHRT
jgi:predicted O-methyltransferase YrrM